MWGVFLAGVLYGYPGKTELIARGEVPSEGTSWQSGGDEVKGAGYVGLFIDGTF